MTRRARHDSKGYYYHVVCRGQRKNPLFFSSKDKRMYMSIVNGVLAKHDLDISAYCLMTNHVHLLVSRNDHPLQNFMRLVNTNYAIYFNRRYGLVGHVFQGRYKSIIVLDESYLPHLVKYIHLNPVKAGMRSTPSEYEYSSASSYECKGIDCIIPLKKITTLGSRQKYLRFMDLQEESTEFPLVFDSIGSSEDFLKLEKRESGREKGKFKERRISERSAEDGNLESSTRIFSKEERISFKKLTSGKKDSSLTVVRLKAILYLLEKGFTRAEISREFNFSRSWVTQVLKRHRR